MKKKKGGKNRSSWPYWLIITGVLFVVCGSIDIKSWKLVLIGLGLIGLVVFILVYRRKRIKTINKCGIKKATIS